MELWPDSDGASGIGSDDEQQEGGGLGALLQEALGGMVANSVPVCQQEPAREASKHTDMLTRAARILLGGKLASFDSIAAQLGCTRRWATVGWEQGHPTPSSEIVGNTS